jgi:hypothetical protein
MPVRGRVVLRLTLSLAAAALLCALALPIAAWGSLPDNRIYEQASPANKDGNVLFPSEPFAEEFGARLGAEGGNAVLYASTGAIGNDSDQGGIQEDLSRRIPGVGWSTEPADPRQLGQLGLLQSPELPAFYGGSEAFSRIYFDPLGCCAGGRVAYVPEEPASGLDFKLYASENPLAMPTWIGKPAVEKPLPTAGEAMPEWLVAGVSPDGSTMYFDYSGALLPEDFEENGQQELVAGENSRAGHIGNGTGGGPWGFYEWSKGGLSEAGVLPNGKLSQYGAIASADAAASRGGEGIKPEENDGQVSENGNLVFFVSPDPQGGAPSGEPPELYMRETLINGGHRSVLASRDMLLPKVEEKTSRGVEEEFPAPAPGGVGSFPNASGQQTGGGTYAYASPDGSRVFFASQHQLTSAAPAETEYTLYPPGSGTMTFTAESATGESGTTTSLPFSASSAQLQAALEDLSEVGPKGVTVTGSGGSGQFEVEFKAPTGITLSGKSSILNAKHEPEPLDIQDSTPSRSYEFDANTEEVAYVPELTGQIAASSSDGSRVMFVSPENPELKRPTQLDLLNNGAKGPEVETILSGIGGSLTPARAAGDGSAFLFYASSSGGGPLSSFNNGGYSQFYRYDVASKELSCVSCPPAGAQATGSAEMNYDSSLKSIQPVRIMSEDGTRVFFQSPDPLVGADVNGAPDVYEWENGHIYLISGGNAPVRSTYIDSSKSGGDVFFLTSQGLVPTDEDEQVDVYDARIPRPGDNPPVNETPCSGDVCQGPPSVPQLLSAAASATFEGLGNIPQEAPPPEVKEVKKPEVKCKKGFIKKNGKCVKAKKKKKANKGNKAATGKRRGE